MASCLKHICRKSIGFSSYLETCRSLKVWPYEVTKSLKEKLKALDTRDPKLTSPIDIGFPSPYEKQNRKHLTKDQRKKLADIRKDKDLELAARYRKTEVPLDEIRKEWLASHEGAEAIKTVATHYGIYRDLFDNAHFHPWVVLNVQYDYDDEHVTPVHHGNHIKPHEASRMPEVIFKAKPNTLWTLILTNPDCHFEDSNSEYLHWFIGNIPGNEIAKGSVICDYMQPFPVKGSGYQRFTFVLFKQEKEIDYSSLQKSIPCVSLKQRTFKTYDFYKEHQDLLTPAGLSFFQSDWHESVTEFFHNVLDMEEPSFEFEHPPFSKNRQVWNPHKVAFDDYLDMHRDPKLIAAEVLQMRLKKLDPFEREPPLPKFPLIQPYSEKIPSWLKKQRIRQNLRSGYYRDL